MIFASPAFSDNLVKDAIEILSRPDGTVRKWEKNLEVAVIGEPDFVVSVDEKLRQLAGVTNLEITVFPLVHSVSNFISDGNLSARSAPGGGGRSVEFQLGETRRVFDVLIVSGTRAEVSSAALALSPSNASMQFAMMLARRDIICHFESLSRSEGIFMSLIFVPTDQEPSVVEACIHTELIQSMGLANALERETLFSFGSDENVTSSTKKNDLDLLKALYSVFRSGDRASSVADVFHSITNAD